MRPKLQRAGLVVVSAGKNGMHRVAPEEIRVHVLTTVLKAKPRELPVLYVTPTTLANIGEVDTIAERLHDLEAEYPSFKVVGREDVGLGLENFRTRQDGTRDPLHLSPTGIMSKLARAILAKARAIPKQTAGAGSSADGSAADSSASAHDKLRELQRAAQEAATALEEQSSELTTALADQLAAGEAFKQAADKVVAQEARVTEEEKKLVAKKAEMAAQEARVAEEQKKLEDNKAEMAERREMKDAKKRARDACDGKFHQRKAAKDDADQKLKMGEDLLRKVEEQKQKVEEQNRVAQELEAKAEAAKAMARAAKEEAAEADKQLQMLNM